MDEKREYIRVPAGSLQVNIRSYSGESDYGFGRVDNISAGGLLLRHETELMRGKYFLITIDGADDDIRSSVKCLASVKRVDRAENGFDIAFKFEWISKDDVARLNSIIASLA